MQASPSPQQQRRQQAMVQWLRSVDMPEHLWQRLFDKLNGDVFDAGASFALARRELPPSRTDERPHAEAPRSEGEGEETRPMAEPNPSSVAAEAVARESGKEEEAMDEEDGAGAAAARAPAPSRAGAGGTNQQPGAVVDAVPAAASRTDGLGEGAASHPEGNEEEEERGGEGRLAPGYVLVATRDVPAGEDVWLVDHCFTFPLAEDVLPALAENPQLVSRLEVILRIPPFTEELALTADMDVAAEGEGSSSSRERWTGWEHLVSAASPATVAGSEAHMATLDEAEVNGSGEDRERARARHAAYRVWESMWPSVGFYHLRHHSAPESANVGVRPGLEHRSAGGARTQYAYLHDGDSAEGDSDDGGAARGAVKTVCCGFIHDEVGSAISTVANDTEVNMKLLPIPVYFPDKECVLSVMWSVRDMPAGAEAKRRPRHRWEEASGVEVSDVLYGRDGPSVENALRLCVASWRNKLAVRQANRAAVFHMMAPATSPAMEGSRLHGVADGRHRVLAQATAAAQAYLAQHGPLHLYTDSPGLLRLASRFPPLAGLLERATLPHEARLLWCLHRTPRSFKELASLRATHTFWLPGEHRFLDYASLAALLHTKIGSRPWCPVVYDGVHQLKEFIGDCVVREMAINWELGSLSRVAEAAGLPAQIAMNVHYDVFAEQKRLLRHQDGTNVWLVQRRPESAPLSSSALTGVSALGPSSSWHAFGGEAEAVTPHGNNEEEQVRATPLSAQATLFGVQRGSRGGAGDAAAEAEEDDEDGGGAAGAVSGAFSNVLLVTENLEAVLKVAEAYPVWIRKLYPSPHLSARRLFARAQAFAGGITAGVQDNLFHFLQHGDATPIFQFIVCVSFDAGAAQRASEERDEGGEAALAQGPEGSFTVRVHHAMVMKWVDCAMHGVKVRCAGGVGAATPANVCLGGPLHVWPLNASAAAAGSNSLPSSPGSAPAAVPLPTFQAVVRSLLHSRADTRALAVLNDGVAATAGGDGDAHPDGLVARCHALLRELFLAVGQDYDKRVTPALHAVPRGFWGGDASSPRRGTFFGVYGVDVSLSLSPMRGPNEAAARGPSAEVQPVLLGVTREPELSAVAAVHPGVYGDILTTLVLDCPVNVTRVL